VLYGIYKDRSLGTSWELVTGFNWPNIRSNGSHSVCIPVGTFFISSRSVIC